MTQDRERRILEVAESHFEKYGYKKTVIDEIVREVGIAKGTFYLHFKSKKQLLTRVIEKIKADIEADFFRQYQELQEDPAELVRMMVRFSIETMDQHPLFAKLLADEPETHFFRDLLELPEQKQEEKEKVAWVQGILMGGIDKGVFREDLDLEVVPYLLGILKVTYFYREFVTGEGMLDLRQLIDGLADMAVRSLLAAPGDGKEREVRHGD